MSHTQHAHTQHAHTQHAHACARFLVVCLIAVCACKKQDEDIAVFETGDDGLVIPNIDLPEGETEGDPEPVALPTGECIQFPLPYVYGYVHQCEGSVRVDYAAQGNSGTYSFTFGPGAKNPALWVEPDGYELPLVAACCGPFDYDEATFEQKMPYLNNCLADSAQQICHALPYLLRRAAAMTDDWLEQESLKWAAGQVEDRELECLKDLFGGGPSEMEPTRLINNTWSPINNVEFTLVDAEVYDWTVEGDVTWRRCGSMFDNDPAVVPTALFQVPGTVAMSQASLLPGTTMTGAGPGSSTATIVPSTDSSSLTLSHLADSSLEVSGFLLEAEASAAEVFGVEVQFDWSSMTLAESLKTQFAGGEYTVGVGDGKFVAMTTFEDGSRTIDFTNVDAIVFRQTTSGLWEFDPFDLAYTETGIGTWTLSFDGMLFAPPPPPV